MELELKNGGTALSVASFNGGDSHFIVNDGCYVLVNKQVQGASLGRFGMSAWLFKEAVEVLKALPSDPRVALAQAQNAELETPIQVTKPLGSYKIQMTRGWYDELKSWPSWPDILKRKGLTEDEIQVI